LGAEKEPQKNIDIEKEKDKREKTGGCFPKNKTSRMRSKVKQKEKKSF